MSNLIYLYVAYTLIWAGTLLYLVKLQVDYVKMKRDIALLSEIAEENKLGKGKKKSK